MVTLLLILCLPNLIYGMQDTTIESQSELENYIKYRDTEKFSKYYKKIVDLRSEHHQKLALDNLDLMKLSSLIEPQAQSDKEIIYAGRKLLAGGNAVVTGTSFFIGIVDSSVACAIVPMSITTTMFLLSVFYRTPAIKIHETVEDLSKIKEKLEHQQKLRDSVQDKLLEIKIEN